MSEIKMIEEGYQKTVEIDGAYTQFREYINVAVNEAEDDIEAVRQETFETARNRVNKRIAEERQRVESR